MVNILTIKRELLGLLLFSIMSPAYGKTSHLRPTASVMQDLFEPIILLLPLVYDEMEFSSPQRKQEIISYLERLDVNVKALENHSRDKAGDFKFISVSFTKDIRNALNWFKKGYIKESRFILNHITENCIACHEKTPAKSSFPQGLDFFKKVDVNALPPFERARLEITTRQFQDACKTYERAFENREIRPASWITFDALTQYLKLTITVNPDLKRAKETLQHLKSSREDLPEYLQNHFAVWIKSLDDIIAGKLMMPVSVAHAQKLVSFGEHLQSFPADRSGLIYFILASSVLEQAISGPSKLPPEQLSEAFYLLGLIEMTVERTFWISQVDNFLELAIRGAPQSVAARKAYNLLEENIYQEFTGSAGTQIPIEKQVLLAELKALLKTPKNTPMPPGTQKKNLIKDKK